MSLTTFSQHFSLQITKKEIEDSIVKIKEGIKGMATEQNVSFTAFILREHSLYRYGV